MHAEAAQILIPSRLPADVEESVRIFATRMCAEVATPLFASRDGKTFEREFDDLVLRGALLRFRWLNALTERPSEEASAILDEWLRPPPPTVRMELQRLAAEMLGEERSFQLQRAWGVLFDDFAPVASDLVQRWQRPGAAPWTILVDAARAAEAAAPHEVLALAWMAVLFGDVEQPRPEVADVAAEHLLRQTSQRLTVVQAAARRRARPRLPPVLETGSTGEWLSAHRTLVTPTMLLLGASLDERGVSAVTISTPRDPEDDEISTLRIHLHVAGKDPGVVQGRIERRGLSMGALGVLSDNLGGMVTITAGRATA